MNESVYKGVEMEIATRVKDYATLEPLNRQDFLWFSYFWELSDGFQVIIDLKRVPQYLRNTMVYGCFWERLAYYQENEMIEGYEDRNDGVYYIVFTATYRITVNQGISDDMDKLEPKTQQKEVNYSVTNQINNSGNDVNFHLQQNNLSNVTLTDKGSVENILNPQVEKKNFFEKCIVPIIVSLIGAIAIIIAAVVGKNSL